MRSSSGVVPSSFAACAAAEIAAAAAACVGAAAAADGLGGAVSGGAAAAAAAAGSMDRGSIGQQPLLNPLHLPGSLAELTGEDDSIALSPFGQLGLNAADVDALLSGFEQC
jgi:hypothetical protein